MKDFIKRNTPVFVIGFITLVVFVGILLAAQYTTKNGPTLEKISREGLIKEYNYTKGSKDAKAYLVEFSDFQCPACKGYEPYVKQILNKYGDNILFAFKHFPLPQHEYAHDSAIVAQAVGRQGKFFEFADKLFENQPNLTRDELLKYAGEVGVDIDTLKKDIKDPLVEQQVSEDVAQGTRLGVSGTPAFIFNGSLLQVTNPEELIATIDREMAKIITENDLTKETTQTTQTVAIPVTPKIKETTATPSDLRTEDEKQADQNFGKISVDYTTFGFRPSNIKAHKDQILAIKNTTKNPMRLEQLIKLYAQLTEPVAIAPDEIYEIRLSSEKLWTFKEASQRHYGTVYVVTE